MSASVAVAVYDPTTLPAAATVIAEWQAAVDQYAKALGAVVTEKQAALHLRQLLDTRRARLQLDERIDGKNAETRAAQLADLLANDAEYQQRSGDLQRAERAAAEADSQVTALEARMSHYRATLSYLAARAALAVDGEAGS